MEQMLTLEVWAVLIAAPCVLSWILGEWHGAARALEREEPEPNADGFFTLTVPPKVLPASSRRSACAGPSTSDIAPEVKRLRRENFADMPPLTQIREEAARIRDRDRIWQRCETDGGLPAEIAQPTLEPDPIGVLLRYQHAIEGLTMIEANGRERNCPVQSERRNAITGCAE